jgi:hypothetical protein
MNQHVITFIGGIIGSSFVTALVTDYLSRKKEKHALKREKKDELGKLYENTLCLLEKAKRDRCRGDAPFEEQIVQTNARLELYAPSEILEQFVKVGSELQKWSSVAILVEPKMINGGLLYVSGAYKRRDECDRLALSMQEEMEKLKRMMRDQIASLTS